MIGTPFFGGHVVRWTPYFRGTSLTLEIGKWTDLDVGGSADCKVDRLAY